MSILAQLLLVTVIASGVRAAYLYNPAPFKSVFDFFKELVPHKGGHTAHGDHGHGGHDDHHSDHSDHSEHHDDHGGHETHESHAPTHHEPQAAQARPLSGSVKVVVYVPDPHADEVRQAIGQAGGGVIGNYSFCTFSSLGTGRYLPGSGAHPMIGTVGVHERVEEERIEFTCSREKLALVVSTIKKVHPYEEIVIDIYPLETAPSLDEPLDGGHTHGVH